MKEKIDKLSHFLTYKKLSGNRKLHAHESLFKINSFAQSSSHFRLCMEVKQNFSLWHNLF